LSALLTDPRYPLSAKYGPQWIVANEVGGHALWLMEALAQKMEPKPGMRVLDLGCGKAIGSIFLAREFGVQVWAVDRRFSPSENWARIKESGVADRVFPIQADALSLPFAAGFFDGIVSVNAYQWFGTDDLYFGRLIELVRPGGQVGLIMPGLLQEFPGGAVPEHLAPYWSSDFLAWHTTGWWRDHLGRTGLAHIEVADALDDSDGWKLWLRWQEAMGREGLIRDDQGRYISFIRLVCRRKGWRSVECD
jgi:SAM-dependent methyltransferase